MYHALPVRRHRGSCPARSIRWPGNNPAGQRSDSRALRSDPNRRCHHGSKVAARPQPVGRGPAHPCPSGAFRPRPDGARDQVRRSCLRSVRQHRHMARHRRRHPVRHNRLRRHTSRRRRCGNLKRHALRYHSARSVPRRQRRHRERFRGRRRRVWSARHRCRRRVGYRENRRTVSTPTVLRSEHRDSSQRPDNSRRRTPSMLRLPQRAGDRTMGGRNIETQLDGSVRG